MQRRSVLALALAGAGWTFRPVRGLAQAADRPQAPLSAAEQSFYDQASAAVTKLYPTTRSAESVGYFRYTNEDRTGAISYVNPLYFNSPDVAHPQQLWYDAAGRLIGGDWSQTVSAARNGPTLFGLGRSRFHHIPLHVHFGLRQANGSVRYGLYVSAADYRAQGGDPLEPTPAGLVKMGKAVAPEQVAFVFALLENWDAQMWVVPNPAGQFADANPNVKPSAQSGPGETQM